VAPVADRSAALGHYLRAVALVLPLLGGACANITSRESDTLRLESEIENQLSQTQRQEMQLELALGQMLQQRSCVPCTAHAPAGRRKQRACQ
jgi:hypothetical protein